MLNETFSIIFKQCDAATFRKLDGTNALSNQSCSFTDLKSDFVCCLKSEKTRLKRLDFYMRQL